MVLIETLLIFYPLPLIEHQKRTFGNLKLEIFSNALEISIYIFYEFIFGHVVLFLTDNFFFLLQFTHPYQMTVVNYHVI